MSESYKSDKLSQCLYQFLQPEGTLFQFMMYQHDHYEGVRYRLPLDKLSVNLKKKILIFFKKKLGILSKLEKGTASEFYQDKIKSIDLKKLKYIPVSK